MKVIMLFLSFIIGHLLFFFVLSLLGLLWGHTYKEVISCGPWFATYTLFIGVWIGGFVARTYYLMHERYFDRVF